ncbi:MAG: tetratricopeptide repeat protein [Endomicrobiaceae bacterium]|nr:tetratricopeptide repeat protein [Endomicrobiaceae bacterium]
MKKIISLVISFLFCFESFSFANCEGYKSYIKGLLALKKGKPEVAVSEFERTLSYDSNATTVYKDLALVQIQQGNIANALESAKKLQELEGDNVKTQMFLGSFYLSVNETDLAKKSWEKVLELEPENEMATVYLASYYYSDNKLKESIDYWTKFLEQQPESAEGYFQLGLTQEKLGMLDKALESYKKVNEIKPEAQEGYLARARIYENKKEYKLAIQEYQEYAKLFSGNVAILTYLGKCYFEEKKYTEAEEVVLKAKEVSPDNVVLNYLLGMIYEKENKISEAIEVFEFIVKKEPLASNYTRLGYYYAIKQDFKSAEKQFNKALEIEPLNSEILYLAGLNYIDSKNYKKAKEVLEQSLYLRPDFTDAKFYLALSYDRLNDFNKTEQLLKEIIEAEPDNEKALNYLGYNYTDKTIHLDEAEQMLMKVIKLQPKVPAYLDSMGWLYYKKKNYELAEKYIFEAVNTTPKVFDKDIYEHLGDVSIELKKLSQAWLSYAVAYDLGSKTAKKKLDLLDRKFEQEKNLQKEKYKVVAERAIFNFHRIASLKAGYKLNIKVNKTTINSYMSVLFARKYGAIFEFPPKLSFQGGSVYVNDDKIEFCPQAIKENIPEDFVSMFDFAKLVLSKDFIKMLLSCETSQKGKTVIFQNNDYTIKIDSKTGMFSEFIKKDLFDLKLNTYKPFNSISKIPSNITFVAEKNNFKCICNLNKTSNVTTPDLQKFLRQNSDDSQSTGQD